MTPSAVNSRPAATLGFWRDLLLVGAVVIAGLYFGRSLLIPFSVSLLIFVLLTSLTDKIGSLEIGGETIPKWVAHLFGIGIIFVGLAAILSVLSGQAAQVVEAVPRYQERLASILSEIVSVIGNENAEALSRAVAKIEVSRFAVNTASTAGAFLGGVFMVFLYIPFMMVERRPMKAKMTIAEPNEVLGSELSKAARSISLSFQRYVGIKTFVSALTGLLSYVVMKSIGLDFSETWGVLAFGLNFIPTVGSILGVAMPSIVALVQFETIAPFLTIVFGCGLIQFIIGNVVEPALTGRSLNLSPMTVILSLTTWTAIWGIPGAFLSVPITVSALIVLSNFACTRWVAILMSGDGKLQNPCEPADEALETAAASQTVSGARTDRRWWKGISHFSKKSELEAETSELEAQSTVIKTTEEEEFGTEQNGKERKVRKD